MPPRAKGKATAKAKGDTKGKTKGKAAAKAAPRAQGKLTAVKIKGVLKKSEGRAIGAFRFSYPRRKLLKKTEEAIDEACDSLPAAAIAGLVRMITVASKQEDIGGGFLERVFGTPGSAVDLICAALNQQVSSLPVGDAIVAVYLAPVLKELRAAHKDLSDYGVEEAATIIQALEAKLS